MMTFKKIMTIWAVLVCLTCLSGYANAQVPGSVTEDETIQDTLPDVMDIGDPCPEPPEALANTPNDLKNIQEDITRFTLCLQRAQLLNRLNDLSKENLETINSTLDEKMMGFIETMEPPQMPEIDMPEPPQMPDVAAVSGPAPASSAGQQDTEPMPEPQIEEQEWMIREVTGRGGQLIAVLVDDKDNLTHVRQGDRLPDSDTLVQSVSPVEVVVREDKETRKLNWVN